MLKQTFFSVGPSQLFPTYSQHLAWAAEEQLGSISHRSDRFHEIYRVTDRELRKLMDIPPTHRIYFVASATEIWERLLLNLLARRSHHLINGSFSERFYNFAQALGKAPTCERVPLGSGFEIEQCVVPQDTELLCTTQNETSTGVCIPEEDLHALKRAHPNTLLCTDIVSSAPLVRLNFAQVDSAFFSVQKAFGMPPGLGVWIVNEACLDRARWLVAQGTTMGAHHTLAALEASYQRFETPATPNTVAIAVLGRIAKDMNHLGIDRLKLENLAKQDRMKQFILSQEVFSYAVENPLHRSPTVCVLRSQLELPYVLKKLSEHGYEVSSGHGQTTGSQIRVALFPATTLDQLEGLLAALGSLTPNA